MKHLALPVLACLLIASCKQAPEKKDLASRLDSLFTSQMVMQTAAPINGHRPGVAVLISVGDSVVFTNSYGQSDLTTGEAINSKTLFNLGSISKTFVANGILMLRDEGKLSLEDSLIRYFPEFKNTEIGRKVKIKHLLTHSSGLPDNRNVNADTVFYLTANDAQNWHPITQTDTLVFEPGTQFEYSNPAYNGLALIIEKVSGQKWQQFIADRIFRPAGMATSTITDGPHPSSGVSHSYVPVHGQWTEDDFGEEPTFCAAGNGGVWSSIDELVLYQKAIDGALFSNAATLAEMRDIKTYPQWNGEQPPFIGWSWFIGKTPKGFKTVGHTGTQGGFYCDYVTIPEKKFFYVMLANFPIDRDLLNEKVVTFSGY